MEMEKNESNAAADSVYVIYPRHLAWLMDENKLTVPEICVALGLTSVQDWFALRRDPDEPVRNTRIIQNARIYLRNPSLLRPPAFQLEEFINRTIGVFDGDVDVAKLAMEAVFHKQWKTIEGWREDETKSIDLAVRRYVDLMMQLDDKEFTTLIVNGIVNTHVQINARSVVTHTPAAARDATFEVAENVKLKMNDALEMIPTPGRRISKNDYKAPRETDDFSTAVADSVSRAGSAGEGEMPMTDDVRTALEKSKAVWSNIGKPTITKSESTSDA